MRRVFGAGLVLTSLALAAPSTDWVDHQEASFRVQLPPAWEAAAQDGGHIFIHSADSKRFVVIKPFDPATGPNPLETVTEFPHAHVIQQVIVDPHDTVYKVTYGTDGEANVLCCTNAGGGMVYGLAAPHAQFAEVKPALLKILQSFQYTGGLTYTDWTDPVEQAFSIQVPQGWHGLGGTFRYAPIDVRRQVQVISPDGRIRMHTGDAKLTTFVGEGPGTRARGLHIGQPYDVNGITYTILPYISGVDFSKEYADPGIRKNHPDLQITGTKDRPDLQDYLLHQMASPPTRLTVGETDFTYTTDGKPFQGACVVYTVQVGHGMAGVWNAYPSSFAAPPEQMEMAWDVFNHLLKTVHENPQWTATQNQVTQEFTQLVMENHERALAMLHAQYEKFSLQLATNGHQFDNVINNLVDVQGPNGTVQTWGGHNYYWSRGSQIVGTDTDRPPDANFSALNKL